MEAAETTFREDHSSDRIIYAPCILQGILIHCILRGLEILVFFVTRVSFTAFIGLCAKEAAFLLNLEFSEGLTALAI